MSQKKNVSLNFGTVFSIVVTISLCFVLKSAWIYCTTIVPKMTQKSVLKIFQEFCPKKCPICWLWSTVVRNIFLRPYHLSPRADFPFHSQNSLSPNKLLATNAFRCQIENEVSLANAKHECCMFKSHKDMTNRHKMCVVACCIVLFMKSHIEQCKMHTANGKQ